MKEVYRTSGDHVLTPAYAAFRAFCMMNTKDSAAMTAFPFLFFIFYETTDTRFLDRQQVFDHAHAVL